METLPNNNPLPPVENERIFPCIWQAILLMTGLLLLLVGSSLVLTIVEYLVLASLRMPNLRDLMVAINLIVLNSLCFAIAIAFVLLFSRRPLRSLLAKGSITPAAIFAIAAMLLGETIIASEMDNITRLFMPMPEFIRKIVHGLHEYAIPSFIALVIVAPLTEEFLFRGVFLRNFMLRHGRIVALLVSSVLFSLMHLNPWQIISSSLIGLLLGIVFIRTRSIWLCIYGHAFHNFFAWAVGFGFFPFKIRGYSEGVDFSAVAFQPVWFDVLGVVLLLAGFASLWICTAPGEEAVHAGELRISQEPM